MEYQGYVIQRVPRSIMWEIKEPGLGGSMPEALKGLFTTTGFAVFAINAYLDSKNKKVEKIKDGDSITS